MIDVELCGTRGQFVLDVAFCVPAQGVTALSGASGSGKTSILRALAGLDRHTGTIRFDDDLWQDATRFVPPHRRRVGWVAQGTGLLPQLSVAGNLAYAARRAAAGPFRHDDVVARTGIGDLLTRTPATLSGGEAQRASIARALLSQPRLLLLDEPLTGLDVAARSALIDQLAELFVDLAIPAIYVTHDVAEAAKLAVRTLRLPLVNRQN